MGCNDLYAVGATDSISGAFCAKTGKLIGLSSQQIIDCSTSFGNSGCEGGDIVQCKLLFVVVVVNSCFREFLVISKHLLFLFS